MLNFKNKIYAYLVDHILIHFEFFNIAVQYKLFEHKLLYIWCSDYHKMTNIELMEYIGRVIGYGGKNDPEYIRRKRYKNLYDMIPEELKPSHINNDEEFADKVIELSSKLY